MWINSVILRCSGLTGQRFGPSGDRSPHSKEIKLFTPTILLLFAFFSLCALALAQEDETKTAPKTGAITGRVVSDSGQPIPHASIYVTTQRALPVPRTTATDDGGNFQVGELDPLVYFVSATAPTYINVPREPDSPPTYYRIGDSASITLMKGGVITGTVTSVAGEPLVQVGVRAQLIRDATGKPPTTPVYPAERRTDDRGVYRIYGLRPGTYVVSAGGRGSFGFPGGAYDTDAPTFSPSSTRDTAAEIVVRSGEESTGIDVRHRGDSGRAISGTVVKGNAEAATSINLTQLLDGRPQLSAYSYQPPNAKGFAFYGVIDGEYDLVAQTNFSNGEGVISEPRRVTVKGADVTGVELVLKALASFSGKVVLEDSTAAACANKRRPVLTETVVVARRSEKTRGSILPYFVVGSAVVNSGGEFQLRNLPPAQFNLNTRFIAKYWYLRSILRDGAPQAAQVKNDVARNALTLKFGERISDLTVRIALGAGSLRGVVNAGEGGQVPYGLYVNLVPAEKESAEDVLRFFVAPVNADGSFALNNLAPGRYWVAARVAAENDPKSDEKLRDPDEAATRTLLRRLAEEAKTAIEFKPCQNVIDYQLPLKNSSAKD